MCYLNKMTGQNLRASVFRGQFILHRHFDDTLTCVCLAINDFFKSNNIVRDGTLRSNCSVSTW